MKLRQLFRRTASKMKFTTRPPVSVTPRKTGKKSVLKTISGTKNGVLRSNEPNLRRPTGFQHTELAMRFYSGIAGVLDEHTIPRDALQLGRPVETPHTVIIPLVMNRAIYLNRIKAMGDEFEVRADWPFGVRVQAAGQTASVIFALPQDMHGKYRLADVPAGSVGLSADRRPMVVKLDADTSFALKILGASGSGKTTLAKAILIRLMQDATPDERTILLCDPKGRLGAFETWPHLYGVSVTDEQIHQAIGYWCSEMQRRRKAMVSDATELVLVIDEAAEALSDTDLRERLVRVLRFARDYGGRLIYINQTDSRIDSHRDLLKLITYWIVGKTANARESANLSGVAGIEAHKLAGGGDFIASYGTSTVQFAGVFVSDADIRRLSPTGGSVQKAVLPSIAPVAPTQPERTAGRPPARVEPATIALMVEYKRLTGKDLSQRQAAKTFGIKRAEWNRSPKAVQKHKTVEALRPRVRAALRQMQKGGTL